VQTLWPHRDALIRAAHGRLPPVKAGMALLAGLRSTAIELAPLALASSASLGRGLFGDDRGAAWIAGSGAHADLSPQAAGSGAFGLGLNFLAHAVGWPFPRGGAGRLTDALAARLRQQGGELRCGAAVDEIEVRARRVAAVRLRDAERVETEGVICTASPALLAEMLPSGALPGRTERRLRGWRYGLGTVKLDYALSGPVPWSGQRARKAGVVHLGGSLGELVASLEQAGSGRFPERPALVIGQQSLHDPSRAPPGHQTLYVYARVPKRPGLSDDEMAERVERSGRSNASPPASANWCSGDPCAHRRQSRQRTRACAGATSPAGAASWTSSSCFAPHRSCAAATRLCAGSTSRARGCIPVPAFTAYRGVRRRTRSSLMRAGGGDDPSNTLHRRRKGGPDLGRARGACRSCRKRASWLILRTASPVPDRPG
jgi:hypothetical protein